MPGRTRNRADDVDYIQCRLRTRYCHRLPQYDLFPDCISKEVELTENSHGNPVCDSAQGSFNSAAKANLVSTFLPRNRNNNSRSGARDYQFAGAEE